MKNVKQKTAWLWRNAEKVLLVTFFLTFTLNIRKVFLTPYSFLNGEFNEYMTMSFSWADLLMLTIIIIYTIKWIFSQSEYFVPEKTSLYNVIRFKSSVIRNYYAINVSHETFYLLIFLGWIGLSIFWSQYRLIAFYRFFTLIEITLFAYIAVQSLNRAKWLKLTFFAIILNGLFQSFLGIAQFIHNGSLGIQFLGESVVGPNIDGVAKILFHGEKHIRSYGTLPHPNILAGFLLVSLFLVVGMLVSRRSSQLNRRQKEFASDLSNNFPSDIYTTLVQDEEKGQETVSHETLLDYIPEWLLYSILLITGLGFFLTFSRSAFLGLFIGVLILLIRFSYIRSRKDIISKNNFKLFIPSAIVLIFITILFLSNTSFFSNQSLQERTLYQNVSYETFLKHPLAGVGIGQFVINEYQTHPNLEGWQYQPVHNIHFLAFSELGIVGLIFFLLWIFSILEWRSGKDRNTDLLRSLLLTRLSLYCIIYSFLLIAFFDHYFWDIKLGTIIFVLPLILIIAFETNSKELDNFF